MGFHSLRQEVIYCVATREKDHSTVSRSPHTKGENDGLLIFFH